MEYLLGTPFFHFQPGAVREFTMPSWQREQYKGILKEMFQSPSRATATMRSEHTSIARALASMQVPYRIILSRDEREHRDIVLRCAQKHSARVVQAGSNWPAMFCGFPRDILVDFGKVVLLGNLFQRFSPENTGGIHATYSPLGEGGLVVMKKQICIHCKSFVNKKGYSSRIQPRHTRPLHSLGYHTIAFPEPKLFNLQLVSEKEKAFRGFCSSDTHIDKYLSLLSDPHGKTHLLIDDGLEVRECGETLSLQAVLKKIEPVCRSWGVPIHLVPNHEVPYALNLEQFSDGRVLMSGGAPRLSKIIRSIVGQGNVFETDVPIRCIPVFFAGGIRCMTLPRSPFLI